MSEAEERYPLLQINNNAKNATVLKVINLWMHLNTTNNIVLKKFPIIVSKCECTWCIVIISVLLILHLKSVFEVCISVSVMKVIYNLWTL